MLAPKVSLRDVAIGIVDKIGALFETGRCALTFSAVHGTEFTNGGVCDARARVREYECGFGKQGTGPIDDSDIRWKIDARVEIIPKVKTRSTSVGQLVLLV